MSQSSVDVWPTYKRLLSYVRPYWFMLVISVIGYALYAARAWASSWAATP